MERSGTYDFVNGEIILIDKPKEWTSFDVVNKIRRAISRKTGTRKIKVGHAGTLDPLATGLLILCTGKFTRRINELQAMEKEYTGTFCLGASTPSYDKETAVDQEFPVDHITKESIDRAVIDLTGEIDQVPPVYSAIKVQGTRAYQMARKNHEVKLSPRPVTIYEFEITSMTLPEIDFRVRCSKGTYIRALARDFGTALASGAYLAALRRTRIGDYSVEDAMAIEDFIESIPTTSPEKS